MSLTTAIRYGLGFLCLIILLLNAIHYYQSLVIKGMADDLNKSREELNDISESLKNMSANRKVSPCLTTTDKGIETCDKNE